MCLLKSFLLLNSAFSQNQLIKIRIQCFPTKNDNDCCTSSCLNSCTLSCNISLIMLECLLVRHGTVQEVDHKCFILKNQWSDQPVLDTKWTSGYPRDMANYTSVTALLSEQFFSSDHVLLCFHLHQQNTKVKFLVSIL